MAMPRRQADVSSLNDTQSFGKETLRHDRLHSKRLEHVASLRRYPGGRPGSTVTGVSEPRTRLHVSASRIAVDAFLGGSGATDVAGSRHLPADHASEKTESPSSF